MRLLKIEEISKFLAKNNVEHSIAGSVKDIEIDENLIPLSIGYSYNKSRFNHNIKLLFIDDKDDNVDTCILCRNPKYVMYFVIFEHILKGLDKPPFSSNYDNNSISSKVNFQGDIKLGFGNQIGGLPFSFYTVNDIKYQVKSTRSVIIGKNVLISSNNVIDAGIFNYTRIGDNSVIDSNCYIAHDVSIGKNCVVTSGVSIGGFSTIGENGYIGMNATIRNNVMIGNNTRIGMGSVVTKNYGDNLTIYGNPAKITYHKCICGINNKIAMKSNTYTCMCGLEYEVHVNLVKPK